MTHIVHVGKPILAALALCAWAASVQAQTASPDTSKAHVYWTNNNNGTIGRATTNGAGVNEHFVKSTTHGAVGGAGLTVNADYIYWTGANGGSATNIGRANIDGSGADTTFRVARHDVLTVNVLL